MSHSRIILYLILFLVAVCLIASGWTDLDWMIVANHFDMWNAQKDTWEFCPYLIMNWWLAFEFTIGRLMSGWLLLGYLLGQFKKIATRTNA